VRLALIADLHANLAALEAVSTRLRDEAPDRVVCLGDLVGYNAEPHETLSLLLDTTPHVVAGNHDRDTTKVSASAGTHAAARQAQTWTTQRLGERELALLADLPSILVEPGEFVAVHGCYLNDTHVSGYVTSTMLEANLLRVAAHATWPALAFCGHTHASMCGFLHRGATTEAPRGTALVEWPRDADAVIVNPGAVGQPRDGDPRAAYAIVDTTLRVVRFERVPYDVERTIAKILAAGLPSELAERLREGR
jgi:diadenosine tetraphosphatase ApaH/serine/threonine PP2A family protein phosphatase